MARSSSTSPALSQTKQWIRNIDFGTSRVNAADQALARFRPLSRGYARIDHSAQQRYRPPPKAVSRSPKGPAAPTAAGATGNTEVAGQGGIRRDQNQCDPYVITTGDTVTYQGNTETQSISAGENQTVQILVPGSSILPAGPRTCSIAPGFATMLESNNRAGYSNGNRQS